MRRLMAGVGVVLGAALGLGVAAPAHAADIIPYVDPMFSHTENWFDEASGKWQHRWVARAEADTVKIRAAQALQNAQAVPSSYFNTARASAAGGASSLTPTQVLQTGNLTRYSRTAVLVAEGALPSTPAGAAAAGKLAPKIPVFGVGAIAKVGSGAAVLGSYQLGAMTGKAGLGLFGIDSAGAVCGNTGNDLGGQFLGLVTGNDCGAWHAKAGYVADLDAVNRPAGWSTYPVTFGTKTYGPAQNEYYQILEPTAPSNVRSGSLTVRSLTSRAQSVSPQVVCRSDTTGAFSGGNYTGGATFGTGSGQVTSSVMTWECGAGKSLYALSLANMNTTNPDAAKYAGTWYSPFSPNWTPGESGSATRTFKTTITGSNGQKYTAETSPFKETDSKYPVPIMPVLPDGVTPADMTIDETGGSTPGPVYAEPVLPEYAELVTQYPECGQGQCMLDLLVNGESCFQGNTDCADWFTDPAKDTKYSCKYGTHAVALSECTVYAEIFKPAGAPIADPQTGAPVPGASPGSSTSPVMDTPVQDPTKPRNCYPNGWAALNPVEWVVQPVGCALEKAFVPKESTVIATGERIADAWADTAPAKVITMIAEWELSFDVAGCDGVRFPFTYGEATVDIGIPSACPGTALHPFALTVQVVGSLLLVITSAMAIRRQAGASIGFNA